MALLAVLLACGLAVGGCTQPETPDPGEAAEDSAPPASPTATSTEDAEPTHMPAAAPPADESSSPPVPAASAAPSCGIHWGSLVKAAPANPAEADLAGKYSLYNVSAGRHACFDRLVLNFTGPIIGYSVGYVDLAFTQPDGDVAGVRGGARLEIIAGASTSRFEPENPREVVPVSGWTTFRQVVDPGSFEKQSELGLGVRARLPFRAFVLAGPADGSSLVVDVAHRW
ncbi:MAG TPA: hypothetical protein VFH02_11795 [Jiangellaceae bacterium]|nr:hypothetical protein [Jiangellaceae bacterium]